MELAALPGGNELAIPVSAREVPTERISEEDRARAFAAAALAVSVPGPAPVVSRGGLIGIGLATFAFGILLTSTFLTSKFNRSWRVQSATAAASGSGESAQPLPRAAAWTPVVEPIVVATAPAPDFDSPASWRPASRPTRDARMMRTGRAVPAKHAARIDGATAVPETVPPAPEAVAPARAAKSTWVDPFAE